MQCKWQLQLILLVVLAFRADGNGAIAAFINIGLISMIIWIDYLAVDQT